MCEPVIPDVSVNDYSMDYDNIAHGRVPYGYSENVTNGRSEPGSERFERFQKNNYRAKWIKNPFYTDDEHNIGKSQPVGG